MSWTSRIPQKEITCASVYCDTILISVGTGDQERENLLPTGSKVSLHF